MRATKKLSLAAQTKATGEMLLTEVYKHLGLEETDYFGLQFIDRKQNVVSCSSVGTVGQFLPSFPMYNVYIQCTSSEGRLNVCPAVHMWF